jgi:hypothetical protein
MIYDIGEANQRQSDFYWGCNDAEDGIAPCCERAAYMRGYNFMRRRAEIENLRAERDEVQAALEGTKAREDRLAERAAKAEMERDALLAALRYVELHSNDPHVVAEARAAIAKTEGKK